MNNFAAIFKKQLKDALKNKEVLIQFVMFPVLTAAHSVSIPLMMVLSLLPMLSAFNDTIAKAAKMLFSEQIRQCFSHGSEVGVSTEAITISAVNLIIAVTVFVLAYRKNIREI